MIIINNNDKLQQKEHTFTKQYCISVVKTLYRDSTFYALHTYNPLKNESLI